MTEPTDWLYFKLDPKASIIPQIYDYARRYVARAIDGKNPPGTLSLHPADDEPPLATAIRCIHGLTIRHDPKLPIGTLALGNPPP